MDYGNYDGSFLPRNQIPDQASPEWMSKGDNAWQLTATTMVCLQSIPGLVILYGSMVKKKWAVNSAFMALYAFAVVLVCWVMWAHRMAFGTRMGPILNRPGSALDQSYLLGQFGTVPVVDYVFYQFAFAAITVVLLAGSLLGRMNFYAWMVFVPLWLTLSYTVGACTIWGGGFLDKDVIDYAGGFVIHLSSGVAGFVAAYWVGPRHSHDRQHFPPNNIIHMLGGAGFLWLGWTGFNGGSPFKAGFTTSLAILNTHLCTAMSLLIWLSLDMIYYQKSSVIGAVQGMITGLVCITPGAGIVEPWAALIMGIMSGGFPWYTMMVLHRKLAFLQSVDDTLGVFHTHAVAGLLGGVLSGFFAKPKLLDLMYGTHHPYGPGLLYGLLHGSDDLHRSSIQFLNQFKGAAFIAVWNILVTSFICIAISKFVKLRMNEEDLEVGDDAVHGEEAYALWGDGENVPTTIKRPRLPSFCRGRR